MWWHRIFQVRDKTFRAVTGMTRAEFEQLVPAFTQAYRAECEAARETARQRALGGGRKGAIPGVRDKLLFILFYVRLYPIQEVHGLLFGLSQPEACYWIHLLMTVLRAALDREVALPARPGATLEELLAQCPEVSFLLDGTERPIRRPKNSARQEEHYSGKKKRHTAKNTIITNPTGRRVVYLGQTRAGRVHDKRAADEDAPAFPADSQGQGDSGYQGYQASNLTMTTTIKKPKGGELTPEQKAANTALAKTRIYVEHAIGGVKVSRIVTDTLRSLTDEFDDLVMEVSTGLFNYKNALRDQGHQAIA